MSSFYLLEGYFNPVLLCYLLKEDSRWWWALPFFSCFCQSSSVNLLFHFLSISFSLLSSFYIIFCFFSLPSSELSVVNFLQYAFLVSLVSSFHSSFFVCLSSFYTIFSSFASLVSSVSLPLFSLKVSLLSSFCLQSSLWGSHSFFFAPSPLPVFSSDLCSVIL